jgi:urea transport system ATP-binding protein
MATQSGSQAQIIKSDIFELCPVLKTMMNRRGGDLSGGQQQQLAIARALVSEPKLIIFDEPTEGIQPSIIKDIGRVIAMLRDQGNMAIVLCEQYFDFAQALADTFIVLSRGEVIASGDSKQMSDPSIRQLLSV